MFFFQTGYHVHDISILNSIHHPILPHLDYSFLNITVANPAINRSTRNNDMKSTHSIVYNGFNSVTPSNSVPLHVKPLNDATSSKQPPKNINTFSSTPLNVESLRNSLPLNVESLKSNSPQNVEPLKNSFPTIVPPNPRKSDMDVSFAIPERNKTDLDFNFASKPPVSELDVDFPIPPIRIDPKLAPPKPKMNFNAVSDPRKVNFDAHFGNSHNSKFPNVNVLTNSNFLNVNSLNNSLEPRSLDLPAFNEPVAPPEEDEFTEFQSATIPTIDEYSDFQSASPTVKYELHSSAAEKLPPSFESNFEYEFSNSATTKLPPPFASTVKYEMNNIVDENVIPPFTSNTSNLPKTETNEVNFMKDEPLDHKTSIEADKYDVFRALMEPSIEEKPQQNAEVCNDDDEDEEDEFGDFYTADVKQAEVKRELSIKVINFFGAKMQY